MSAHKLGYIGLVALTGCLYQPHNAPIHVPLSDHVSPEHEEKVHLVEDIKRFTIEELDMPNTTHYTKYLPGDLSHEVVQYNLYVSSKDTIDDRRFPKIFVGRQRSIKRPAFNYVIYESYVDNFEDEKAAFEKLGFTAHIHRTTQYTSPTAASQITEELLNESPVDMAIDICHEQIHANLHNLWSIPMHESIAGFLDSLCAYEYFMSVDDRENASLAYDKYLTHNVNAESLAAGYSELETLYKSAMSLEDKETKSQEILTDLELTTGYELTNAKLAQKVVYYENSDILDELYTLKGKDVKSTLAVLEDCPITRKGCIRHIKRQIRFLKD